DRLGRRLRDPADPPERVANLLVLRLELRVVGEVLEAAAAASRVVRAGRVDALIARLDDLDREGLRVAALDLRDPGTDGVARQAASDEDDEPVQPRDAVATEGERVDMERELLVLRYGRGHRRQATVVAREIRGASSWSVAAAASGGNRNRGRGCREWARSRARSDADRGVRQSAGRAV